MTSNVSFVSQQGSGFFDGVMEVTSKALISGEQRVQKSIENVRDHPGDVGPLMQLQVDMMMFTTISSVSTNTIQKESEAVHEIARAR
ncbi:protein of unknown function [Pararobbsia alpina]|uniref:hypothetical protein n=1 Tax=Pararobbsia alpina TaxID=621374 RepID=UPI0039A5126C